MKIKSLVSILALTALIVSCKTNNKGQFAAEKPVVVVDVVVAGAEHVNNSLEVNGAAVANEMVELHPEVSGRLIYLNMPDGSYVKEGTLLARINDADLQAQVEQQNIQLELAIKTEKRLSDLLKVNGVNQADYDVALSQVNTIQANLKVLKAQLDKTVIKAPFSGELGIRVVSPGAYVTAQTILGTINQIDKVKIDFTVPESYAGMLEKGRVVKVQTNVNDSLREAVVSAIEPQINSASRNIKVRALLKDGVIPPGAFVKVLIDQSRNGIMVPSNAIIPDALSNQVVVVRKKKAVFVNVTTGLRNTSMIEITNGLVTGDSIIVSGMLFVRPGGSVKIGRVKKLTDN